MLVMFKHISFKFLFFLGISPLFLLLISGCNNKDIEVNQNLDNNELVDRIDAVAALGQLNPLGEVRKLAAPNSGKGGTPRLSKLLIGEGDYVHKEQILAVFDNRPKLEANLKSAQANLNILMSEISIKKREINRYQTLVDKGAVARIVLDKMKDDLSISETRILKLKSAIDAIEVDLEQTELKSPIDGIVLQILVREGERPNSAGVINVGANQLMEALIEVYESDIDRVQIAQAVDLISENGGFDGSLRGQVSLISPQVRQRRVLSTDPTGDADSRVVEVRVKLDNASAKKVSHLTGMKVIARFLP
ncbi:efflux RND transporter periplasmic adaptor subunit [Prochlorococcus marinus]|uniref:efflux RND transporter periplasmic adaptor subunit n=1 Tax=Prochlorococcus marinus TaxID=1219 RepID=UPI0039B06033